MTTANTTATNSWTIVVLDPIPPARAEQLRALLPPGFALTHGTARGDEHLKAIIAEADFAIAGQVAVSADVFGAAKRLKLLHKWGVGVDNIDVAAAGARGIAVARTTGANAVPVAEFTLGLTIAALRNLAAGHAELRAGRWRSPAIARDPYMLSGKTVGIVGMGAIGQAFARLLTGFGCPVLYTKRTPLAPAAEAALNARRVDLPELLATADVVSLHCPLTPETTNLIDRAALSRMKPTAVLVNAARGGVVVEADLKWALETKVILAAATDVYAEEPLPPGDPLLSVDGLVTTPHLAALAVDTFEPTVRRMFETMRRVAEGLPVPERDLVTG
jgi:phosphoglycerate dehydrogenase-like enzyme